MEKRARLGGRGGGGRGGAEGGGVPGEGFIALGRVLRLFGHLGDLLFFITFSVPFWIDFWLIFEPNLLPKIYQNRKNRCQEAFYLRLQILDQFLISL